VPLPGGRLQFGSQDAVEISVYLGKKDGTGGATGLAAVELIALKPSNGAKVTLTTKLFSQVNATDVPGVYEIKVPASEWPEFGVYQARVDPADATVDEPEPFTFERLSGAATTAPPGGNNLCTLADVQGIAGATTAAQDSIINGIIPRVSDFIHTRCRRKFPAQAFTETHDGNGKPDLRVRNPPIVTLTSITIDAVAQTLADLKVYSGSNEGKIYHSKSLFSLGRRNIIVAYSGGFSTLPGEIMEVAIEMAWFRFQRWQRKLIGIAADEIGDGVRRYTEEDFLPGHLERLNPWVLYYGAL